MIDIIRTPAEMEALDPDTLLLDAGPEWRPMVWQAEQWQDFTPPLSVFPFVVIATGEEARAAREALNAARAGRDRRSYVVSRSEYPGRYTTGVFHTLADAAEHVARDYRGEGELIEVWRGDALPDNARPVFIARYWEAVDGEGAVASMGRVGWAPNDEPQLPPIVGDSSHSEGRGYIVVIGTNAEDVLTTFTHHVHRHNPTADLSTVIIPKERTA